MPLAPQLSNPLPSWVGSDKDLEPTEARALTRQITANEIPDQFRAAAADKLKTYVQGREAAKLPVFEPERASREAQMFYGDVYAGGLDTALETIKARHPRGAETAPLLEDAFRFSEDKREALAMSLNMAYATDVNLIPADKVTPESWPAMRAQAITALGGDAANPTDSQLFGLIAKDSAKNKAKSEAHFALATKAAERAFEGKPWSETMMADAMPLVKEGKIAMEDVLQWQETYKNGYDGINSYIQRNPDMIGTVKEVFSRISEINATSDITAIPEKWGLTDKLYAIGMKAESDQEALIIARVVGEIMKREAAIKPKATTVAEAGANILAKGPAGEMGDNFVRMWKNLSYGALAAFPRHQVDRIIRSKELHVSAANVPTHPDLFDQWLESEDWNPGDVIDTAIEAQALRTRPLTREESIKVYEKARSIDRGWIFTKALNETFDERVAPLDWMNNSGLIGKTAGVVSGAAASISMFAVNPGAARMVIAGAVAERELDKLKVTAPDLGWREAHAIAAATGVADAAIEQMQSFTGLGKLPVTSRLLAAAGIKVRGQMARVGIGIAAGTTGNIIEEAAQHFNPTVWESLVNGLNEDMPIDVSWSKELAAFKDQAPELVMGMFVLSAFTHGYGSSVHWKADGNAMQLLRDETLLRIAGIGDAKIRAQITGAATHEEALAKFNAATKDRDTEDARKATVEYTDMLKETARQQAMTSAVRRTEHGTYLVKDAEGRTNEVGKFEDAWKIAATALGMNEQAPPPPVKPGPPKHLNPKQTELLGHVDTMIESEPMWEKVGRGETLRDEEKALLKEKTLTLPDDADPEVFARQAVESIGATIVDGSSLATRQDITDLETEIAELKAEVAAMKPAPRRSRKFNEDLEDDANDDIQIDRDSRRRALDRIKEKTVELTRMKQGRVAPSEGVTAIMTEAPDKGAFPELIPKKPGVTPAVIEDMEALGWTHVKGFGFVFGSVDGGNSAQKRDALSGQAHDEVVLDLKTPSKMDWLNATRAILGADRGTEGVTDGRKAPQFRIKGDTLGFVSNQSAHNEATAMLRRQATARGKLPKVVFDAKIKAANLLKSIEKQAEQNLKRMERALKIATRNESNPVAKAQLRQETLFQINEFMTGARAITDLVPEIRGTAKEMRAHVDAMTDELIAAGVVEGDIVQTMLDNKGTYLNRAYRRFSDPEWSEKVDLHVRNTAKAYLRTQLPQRAGESAEEYEDRMAGAINRLLITPDGPIGQLARQKLGAMEMSQYMRRGEIPAELRALWGEYDLAHENYARTIAKMAQSLASHKFQTEVRDMGLGVFLFTDVKGQFVHQIAAAESKSMEPLAGLYTTKEIAEGFAEMGGKEYGALMRAWLGFNGLAKYSNTLLNPTTHVRNFVANPLFLIANGNLGGVANYTGKSARALLADILPAWALDAAKSGTWSAQAEADLREYIELGVAGSVTADEMKATIKDAFQGDITLEQFVGNQIQRNIKKTVNGIANLYSAEDSFWKIIAFESEKAKLAKAKPSMTEQELKLRAAKIVELTMPNYDMTPQFIKAIRQFPLLGSFVSFQSEVYRTQYNGWKLALEEIKDKDLKAIGGKRIAGLITAQSLPIMFAAFMSYITGTSDDDDEAMRELMPPWDQNAMVAHLPKDSKGRPRYINLSYVDPFATFKNPFVALTRGLPEDEAIAQALGTLIKPFVSEEIGTAVLLDVARNRTKEENGTQGREIWNPQADFDTKMKLGIEHILSAIKPGALKSAERINKAIHGEGKDEGRDYGLATEIAAIMTGQRIATINPENAISFKAREYANARMNSTRLFTTPATRDGNVPDEELLDGYRQSVNAKKRNFEQFAKEVSAAIRFGVPVDEMETIGAANGVGVNATADVINENYQGWELNSDQIDRIDQIEGRREQIQTLIPDLSF